MGGSALSNRSTGSQNCSRFVLNASPEADQPSMAAQLSTIAVTNLLGALQSHFIIDSDDRGTFFQTNDKFHADFILVNQARNKE
jgi:hypothetical protein